MKYLGKMNAQKGFTLLEMLVAVTILATGLLATAAMQSVAVNSNSIANRSSVVTALAGEVMEEVMSRSPSDPQLSVCPNFGWRYDLEPTNPLTTDRIVPSAGTYRVDVTTNHPCGTGIVSISLTVTRLDNVSNKGLSGVRGSGAGGAFILTNFKKI